jgi:biopolymer transport protein ExbD
LKLRAQLQTHNIDFMKIVSFILLLLALCLSESSAADQPTSTSPETQKPRPGVRRITEDGLAWYLEGRLEGTNIVNTFRGIQTAAQKQTFVINLTNVDDVQSFLQTMEKFQRWTIQAHSSNDAPFSKPIGSFCSVKWVFIWNGQYTSMTGDDGSSVDELDLQRIEQLIPFIDDIAKELIAEKKAAQDAAAKYH